MEKFMTTKYLRVPGKWLNSCGYGTVDRVFVVKRTEDYGFGRIIAIVDRDGYEWTVCTWMRGATFVTEEVYGVIESKVIDGSDLQEARMLLRRLYTAPENEKGPIVHEMAVLWNKLTRFEHEHLCRLSEILGGAV
jgi:hypothetical protein